MRLFLDRAHRARPSFTVSDDNAPAIAQICHRLDGIPLAIELAAARCRQTSAERIAADLDDRFRYLTGGARTVMPRQQTLAASVDWSYERLDDAERTAFRRLGVFAGPFPLEAAEAVVASPGDIDRDEVFDLISRLVDKSLVVADEDAGGQPRYRLLETLRAYATAQAHTAGELAVLRDAHADWWTEWLEPHWVMPSDETLAAADQFHGNLVAALEWSTMEPIRGLTLLTRLGKNLERDRSSRRRHGRRRSPAHRRERRTPRTGLVDGGDRDRPAGVHGTRMSPRRSRCSSASRTSPSSKATTTTPR